MISFPAASWQSALIKKTTNRRPNDADQTYGRLATPISPRLYLSDLYTARAPGNLARMGITHVVSALEADLRAELGDGVVTMHVPIRDSSDTDITKWFDEVVRFIRDALDADERNKVLVHCLQGISRSATLVCAYLIATSPMRALDALAYVQAKRGIVAPNLGFRHQLVVWGRQFDEEKTRAEEEQRKKRRGVVGKVWSEWVGKAEKSSGQV
ncbi:phosphatases II [Phlebopus sp. FC_14]|nr:phosphatases II [Phlebopus sp. FC_14]